jgi:hypothetical protein
MGEKAREKGEHLERKNKRKKNSKTEVREFLSIS